MRTVLVVPCRKALDVERLQWAMHDSDAFAATLSVTEENYTTFLPFPATVVVHENIPFKSGSNKVVKYMNEIVAPLAKAAVYEYPDADSFLFSHDDIEPDQKIFRELLSLLKDYSFASASPVYAPPTPGETEPILKSHSSRLVAWRADAFKKYLTRGYPKDAAPGFDSMDYVMNQMDKEGDKFIWTNLKPTHVQL